MGYQKAPHLESSEMSRILENLEIECRNSDLLPLQKKNWQHC